MLLDKHHKAIGSLSTIVKLFIQLSIIVGVLVTLKYCSVIEHYPTGLTIGDTLFFIAASLAFTATYLLFVYLLLSAGITLSPFLRWGQLALIKLVGLRLKIKGEYKPIKQINFPPLHLGLIVPVLTGLLIIYHVALSFSEDFQQAFELSTAIILMGVFWGCWNTKIRRKSYDKNAIVNAKITLATLTLLSPLFVIQDNGSFLNQSMKVIGVRTESSTIQVAPKYIELLGANGSKPYMVTGTGEAIFKDAIIVFKGIGSDVVVEINDLRIAIPAKDIVITKSFET